MPGTTRGPDDNVAETRRLSPRSKPSLDGGAQNRLYLLVVEGGSSSLFHLPPSGVVLIGRGSETQLRLTDSSVSRRHAQIVLAEGKAQIADLESSNGTSVNGERVTGTAPLHSGDVIAVGDVTLVFHGLVEGRTRGLVDLEGLLVRLEEEIERSLRYQRPLSLLSIVLARAEQDREELSRKLFAHLPPLCVAGFDGDSRLLLLLPELGADGAGKVAAELVPALLAIAPRVKVGLATCPEDGCDAGTLLSAARAAAGAAQSAGVAAARESVTRLDLDGRSILIADPAMGRLFDLIRRLAPSDLPVLIHGETGVGKENAAFAVHYLSPRRGKPFTAINCAAIHETLVESELFGHEKGAFSGATAAKPGHIENSSGGSLFLDEIGELSPSVQAKLLRVLEMKKVTRLGELRERDVDIRIVAATNRDLEREVREGRFRQDLFFRLSGANIILPPLRERPREVPILAREFLTAACARLKRAPMTLSPATMRRLATYPFPGNVRELKNLMDYVAAAVEEEVVEPWHLPEKMLREGEPPRTQPPSPGPVPFPGPLRQEPSLAATSPTEENRKFRSLSEEIKEMERTRMLEALRASGGVRKRAAQLLDMPLRTFVMKIKQYGIS